MKHPTKPLPLDMLHRMSYAKNLRNYLFTKVQIYDTLLLIACKGEKGFYAERNNKE